MPTNTFFRLPAEKRERLMEACWAEFTRQRFSEVSINRIISAAHIPRGSFYQYFGDKEELFLYLLKDIREYFLHAMQTILREEECNLFALPLRTFDRFLYREGETDPTLARLIQILQVNQGWDFQTFLSDCPGDIPESLWDAVDTRGLKVQDRDFVSHVFFLLIAVLAFSVAETLRDPGQWARQREIIQTRVEIIRSGCAAQCGEEEPV